MGASAEAQGEEKVVPPAPSIAAFRKKVVELHFTNGSDKEVVADLYEKMLRAAERGAMPKLKEIRAKGMSEAGKAAIVKARPGVKVYC